MGTSRRNAITLEDARVVVLLAAISGVVGALAGCRPTGNAVVDAVLCAATAAFVTWIGASAPWWALIVAAGGAAVFAAAGGGIVATGVAFAALAVALWIGSRRANLPWARALIAGATVQVAFRIEWNPFFLASAAVAAMLVGVLVVTGVRRRQRYVRRRVYWSIGALGVMVVVSGVGLLVAGAQARPDAGSGYTAMLDGLEFVQRGETARGAEILWGAAADLAEAEDALGRPWALPARLVPGLAQNRDATFEVIGKASEAAASAAATLDEVDVDRLRVVDGVVDLTAFDLLAAPLSNLDTTVSGLLEALVDARTPWLVGPLQDRFEVAETRAAQVQRQAAGTAELARLGPDLLGRGGPRRYFVAFVNPAEARATAGFMGSWAEMTVDQGRLSKSASGRTAELESAVRERSPLFLDGPDWLYQRYRYWLFDSEAPAGTPDPELPVTYNAFANAFISPDMRVVGSVFHQLLGAAVDRPIDGMLAIGPRGLAAILEVTGPIDVEGIDFRLDGSNAEQFLLLDQYEFEEQDRERILEAVTVATVDKLLETTLPAPYEMAATLSDAALNGHISMWALRGEEQEFFEQVGIDGAMPDWTEDTWSDVLAVTVNNASGNKIDNFLDREVEYRPVYDPDSGEVRAALRITLQNDAPTSGYEDYVIGNLIDEPTGTHQVVVEVFTPLTAGGATVNGRPHATTHWREGQLNVHLLEPIVIPSGGTVVIELELTGRVATGFYELLYRPQVLPRGERLTIDARDGASPVRFEGELERRSVISRAGVRAWR